LHLRMLAIALLCESYQLPRAARPAHRPVWTATGHPYRSRTTLLSSTSNTLLDARDSSAAAAAVGEMPRPTYNDTWYAVAYSHQLQADELFATRLWGEPLVLYRDEDGEVVCVRDVCPHRSAPLSMGDVKDGVLRCFYHGWGYGADGKCVSVPTMGSDASKSPSGSDCNNFATVELDGMLWVWRGHVLSADATKLPRLCVAEDVLSVDTTLDYGCAWANVIEASLESWNMASLSSGSDAGGDVRFDAPNVVHRGTKGGISEELHVVPIAPDRTRVMLRQRFPKGPTLSALLQLPGASSVINWMVQNWNYQVAQKDYAAVLDRQGVAGAVASDLVQFFWKWKEEAEATTGQPYFSRWDGGQRPRYGEQNDDGETGTYGLKRSYIKNNPAHAYAPLGSPLPTP